MDKKQKIINEYLLGKTGYRLLSKKHCVSRSANKDKEPTKDDAND